MDQWLGLLLVFFLKNVQGYLVKLAPHEEEGSDHNDEHIEWHFEIDLLLWYVLFHYE